MKFNKGSLYKITFLDHCVGIKEEMKCHAVGWVIHSTKLSVTISHWIIDSSCDETKMQNIEPTTIVKSTILKARLIK